MKDGEVSATKFVKSGHMNAQADITPIEFGGLDEALSAIHGIRGNAHEQKGRLKQVQVAVHGWLTQRDVT